MSFSNALRSYNIHLIAYHLRKSSFVFYTKTLFFPIAPSRAEFISKEPEFGDISLGLS